MSPKKVAKPSTTYRDGTGRIRCSLCLNAIQDASGQPTVPILLSDVEEIAILLVEYVNCPGAWGPTITRLEQASGRTIAQMKEAGHTKWEAPS